MEGDRLWLLVSLKLSGEATEEELTALDLHLQQNPDMVPRLDALSKLWLEKHPGLYRRKDIAFNKHLQRLSNHLSEPGLKYETSEAPDRAELPETFLRSRRSYSRLWPASGMAAAALIAFFVFVNPRGIKKGRRVPAQNTVSTKPGSKSKIQLPDGSQVWLNGDSRIAYNETFHGLFREVHLWGEAYFDVAKDKDHPFIIHVGPIDIKVLGTSLNVRSYNNEKNTETALIRGSVEITLRSNPEKKIILRPNEKLVVQNGKVLVKGRIREDPDEENTPLMTLSKIHYSKKDSTATEVLWVKNKLAFDKETLENVAMEIERWYDVKVIITDESLKAAEFSGVFEDESLRQVMEALRMTGNFRYSINRKEVIIKP